MSYDDPVLFTLSFTNMTDVLVVCLLIQASASLGTIALLTFRVVPGELQLWQFLRIQELRKWITRRRKVNQPLVPVTTLKIARDNLRWHLILTLLFCGLVARAFTIENFWLRVLASLLVLPSIAYLGGSLVQRQKIAILHLRAKSPLVRQH